MSRLIIFILAINFYIMENNYFGWNAKPKSDAELIADGIVLILLAMAALKGNEA